MMAVSFYFVIFIRSGVLSKLIIKYQKTAKEVIPAVILMEGSKNYVWQDRTALKSKVFRLHF